MNHLTNVDGTLISKRWAKKKHNNKFIWRQPNDRHSTVALFILQPRVLATCWGGDLALLKQHSCDFFSDHHALWFHFKNLVGQLVQSLLNDHPYKTIRYKFEIRPGGVFVSDDGLELFDLVGAGEHLGDDNDGGEDFNGGADNQCAQLYWAAVYCAP